MKRLLPAFLALCLYVAPSLNAQGLHKDGIVNLQAAMASTKEGQKASNDLQVRFGPRKAEFERRQAEIGGLQDRLNRGANTLSDDARQNLVREIEQKTKSLNRDNEDARAELDQEQQKLMNQLGGRMISIIERYAKDNGYTLVLDVSSPQTPVLFRAESIDITKEIIELYDKSAGPK